MPEEEIVRRVFVDTPNATIVAGLRKNNIDAQEGVLTIIKHFESGRKFKGWNANGYYSRTAIDRKLVGLCRRVNFCLFDQAMPHVPPTFFHVYNWIRRNCSSPTLEQIEDLSARVLEHYSTRAIVRVLQEHPEEKNNVMLAMLRNMSAYMKYKSKFVKMYDKKMQRICKIAEFERWADILPEHAFWSEAMRTATIHALAVSNPDSLKEHALEAYRGLLDCDFTPHQLSLAVEQCLLESPSLDLYKYQELYCRPYTFTGGRSLFGDYIFFKHYGIKPGDTFFNVLHRPSDDQFKELWNNLRKVSAFQKALYMMSVTCLQGDDERLKVIHDAAAEIQSRINGWADKLNINRANLSGFESICYKILEVALAEATGGNEQIKELLLDIFRSAHRFYECEQFCFLVETESVAGKFGLVLTRLMALGIKPNVALCPDDPKDERTLFSAYMFMQKPSIGGLRYAQDAWNALSKEERLAEAMHWRKSYEVAQSFETYSKSLVKIASGDKQLLAFVESLVAANGIVSGHADVVSKSLVERLLTDD